MKLASLLVALFSLGALTALGGTKALPVPVEGAAPDEIERAVERSLPLMQASMQTWTTESGCISCHHQALGTLAVSLASERGFEIDFELLDEQVARMADTDAELYAAFLQGEAGINPTFGHSYVLLALAATGYPRNDATDAKAYFLAGNISDEGAWYSESHRPPLEDSPVTATALATRALLLFRPDGRTEEFEAKIRRGREWLTRVEPHSNEERAMRLFGLGWTGAAEPVIAEAAADLLRRQRADGGWAQIPTRASDAYATGQALVALQQIRGLSVDSPTYRKGIRFLLDTQHEDGSWLVETRRRSPGLPYFESGFPHKLHQFISFAATAWATSALCLTVDPGPSPVFLGPRPEWDGDDGLAEEAGLGPVHRAAAYGTLAELQAELEAASVDARGPGGLTPLMLAVHDERKTALLLEAGASVDATTSLGYTPLILAGWYSGGSESLELLLERGAAIDATSVDGSSALLRAARTGERAKLVRLLEREASVEEAYPDGLTVLLTVEATGNLELVRLLLDRGAEIEARWLESGMTTLMLAAHDGWTGMVRELIERGAKLDAVDEEGMTALAWAAKVDHGHVDIVRALLDAGADPDIASSNGRTPLEWARFFDNQHVVQVLADPR